MLNAGEYAGCGNLGKKIKFILPEIYWKELLVITQDFDLSEKAEKYPNPKTLYTNFMFHKPVFQRKFKFMKLISLVSYGRMAFPQGGLIRESYQLIYDSS
jgi:hypothetical protein